MADAQSAATDPVPGTPPAGAPATPPTTGAPAPDTTATTGEAGAEGKGREAEAPPSLLSEKPAEAAKPVEPVPFDFAKVELPEGMTLPDETKAALAEAFTKPDLTPEARASALMRLYAAETAKISAGINEAWTKTNNDWIATAQADSEIGGDRLRSDVIPTVAKFLDAHGDPGVREALNITGAGNHPAIIKTLYRAAKALTEGGHVAGKPPGTSPARAATIGAALYGTEGPKTSLRGE